MVSPPTLPSAAAKKASRIKREDHPRTKHDSIFSNWQILIGPYDWENYARRKDGSERYRIHNLPTRSSPGIYELGVSASNKSDDGRATRKLAEIVVVYVGQADNVRTRLQHYGRAGSHLDRGNCVNSSDLKTGSSPGLFKEIFARGFSIVFRWAPMKSKREAENAEVLLLGVFDYAWNRVANGSCRREDVLLRLESISRGVSSPFSSIFQKLQFFKVHAFNRKRVGIKLEAGEPTQRVSGTCPPILEECNHKEQDDPICGIKMTDGSICRKKPVSGRKRCADHRGMRIKASNSKSISQTSHLCDGTNVSTLHLDRHSNDRQVLTICGVRLEDGSICSDIPPRGRKRCQMHKGRRIIKTKAT